ncbi:MAG: aldehyde dehydrogenase family protein [Cloacibacillus porcorum]|uniref:aldehyde dehydrogenase family protein n=1 Tax=Cloacibacillus porcorum TaxID=1197717 RepID=UPI0023F488D8|nr:aldehyde dehydrogenase family protein [Cloacibacillus porcorum]MCD7877410.1 aldehyde dehydrogenase family protein [Cloacibacillus porcorum]
MNLKMYINGQLIDGQGSMMEVINPAYNKPIASFNAASEEQAEAALQAAQAALKTWGGTSINERLGWMQKLVAAIQANREELLDIVAQEGKSYNEANGQINTFISYMNFYGEEVKRVYETGVQDYGAPRGSLYHLIYRRPLGVVVGHLPWNSPLNLLGVKLAPAMASGCPCVLKPSTSTPLASMFIAKLAYDIGLPEGAFNLVTGKASIIGKYLNSSPIPKMITLVGSSEIGVQVMREASTSIKRFSFELGGNAPCIIMPDADIDKIIPWMANKKVPFTGQSCATVNRFFIHESLHDRIVPEVAAIMKKVPLGWGRETPGAMGPMINVRNRDAQLELIEKTVAQGAKMLYGGRAVNLPEEFKEGAFILPTLLDNCTDDMDIAQQEIFCPLYPIYTFKTLDEVIERANNTKYGLTSYLMTHDSRVIARCMEDLEFGEVEVNMATNGAFLSHVGIKESGVGCDRSLWSLDEYFSIRRLSVKP